MTYNNLRYYLINYNKSPMSYFSVEVCDATNTQ